MPLAGSILFYDIAFMTTTANRAIIIVIIITAITKKRMVGYKEAWKGRENKARTLEREKRSARERGKKMPKAFALTTPADVLA